MSFLAWIVLGLLAGFIGSKIVNKSGEGILMDIVLGILGAVSRRMAFQPVRPHGRHRAQSVQPGGSCNWSSGPARDLSRDPTGGLRVQSRRHSLLEIEVFENPRRTSRDLVTGVAARICLCPGRR